MSSLSATKKSASARTSASATVTSYHLPAVTLPINESWRLCIEHKWTDLQMRLGVFTNEARAVHLQSNRSLLHEVVSAVGKAEIEAALLEQNENQHQQQQQQKTATKGGGNDNIIAPQESSNGSDGIGDSSVSVIEDRSRATTTNRVASPLFLRSIYFSCPQAMLLQESEKGYTPLHCALTLARSTRTTTGEGATRVIQQQEQTLFGLIDTLLELCQGRRVVDSDHDWFEESKEEESYDDDSSSNSSTEDDEDDVNERAVLLLRDHLGDTPLHTACRLGCSKRILQILMEACPSALYKSNRDGMTPMRLLWNNLEDYIKSSSNSNDGVHTKINAEDNNEQEAAKASASKKEAPRPSPKLSILEDILEHKIKTYEDLIKFPDIKDTWEKSVMLLHILRTWGQSSKEENDLAIVELMDHDILRNFLMRRESRDFLLPTSISSAALAKARQVQQDDYIKTKRKHDAPVVEVKGVVPDAKGMIPMRSYKSNSAAGLIGRRTASHHGSMHSYLQCEGVETTNLFFERA